MIPSFATRRRLDDQLLDSDGEKTVARSSTYILLLAVRRHHVAATYLRQLRDERRRDSDGWKTDARSSTYSIPLAVRRHHVAGKYLRQLREDRVLESPMSFQKKWRDDRDSLDRALTRGPRNTVHRRQARSSL